MKTAVFCFLIFSLNVSSQDSSRLDIRSEKFCTIRLCPFPIFYGAFWGGGIIINVEKSIAKNQSFCLGGKYLTYTDIGGYLGATHKLLIFEYRFYLEKVINEPLYISPYIKLRDLNFFDVVGGSYPKVTKFYNESSLGVGFTYGANYHLDKKRIFDASIPFLGAGYFFRLNHSSSYKNAPPLISEYEPSSIYRSFDFRVGVLFGINLKK